MSRLPTLPGEYLWTEWDQIVHVYETRAGNLVLRAPNGQTLRVTPRLAGRFIAKGTAEHRVWLDIPAFLRRSDPPFVGWEHPRYSDWKLAVANDETVLGLATWLEHQAESGR